MNERNKQVITGQVFDEAAKITIVELCQYCSVDIRTVERFIDEGIIDVEDGRGDRRRLPYAAVHRTHTVLRMQRDLGVNTAGAALALDLLDRINELRAELLRR